VAYTRHIIEQMGAAGPALDACAREICQEWATCDHFEMFPEVPRILKALFNIDSPPAPRNDLLAVVLGVDGLTRRPGEVVSDQLRLNVAVFPTPPSLANRLGVLGGDLAGFPNGRRPYDDVVDIELRILAGVLVPAFNVSPNNALGDGVDGPDKAYNPAFPYAATPHSGFSHSHDNAPQVTHFGAEASDQ